jgi:hypothetical protein
MCRPKHVEQLRNIGIINSTTWLLFELLMMGGVSPETRRAIKKHWNNKFNYTVAFSAPDDGRCVARNMSSNQETLE